MLAAFCRTGSIKVRQPIWEIALQGNPERHVRSTSVKAVRSPRIHRHARRQTICRNSRRIDRQRTFPIVPPRPPRLRPWEVFQRGSSVHQAAPSRRDPHQKTFTIAAVCYGSPRRSAASPKRTLAMERSILVAPMTAMRDKTDLGF